MIIMLPWIQPIDTLNLPKNFDEQVRMSFKKYTEGTSKEYRYQDKLSYLDNMRAYYLRNDGDRETIVKMIGERVAHELEDCGEFPSTEEIYSIDFMEECYERGFRPFIEFRESSKSRNDATLKVILRIIQIVVNYEDEE